jgi:hypothetical protein
MQWSDIASTVGKFAPLVGTALGGPAGAAVGAIVSAALGTPNSPDAVSQALQVNPDAAVKLAEIEKDKTLGIQQLVVAAEANRLAADTAAIQAVNTTMQAEDKSDHWPTYTWRPFIGFAVGLNVVASSVLVLGVFAGVVFGAKEAAVAVAQLPMVLGALAAINGTVLPILGIASWYRGKMQASGTADVRG